MIRIIVLSALFLYSFASCSNSNAKSDDEKSDDNKLTHLLGKEFLEKETRRNDEHHYEHEHCEVCEVLNGSWFPTQCGDSIWSVYGRITFDADEHTYGSYDGCNHSTSSSFYCKDGKVILERGAWTLKYCECNGMSGIPDCDVPLTVEKVEIDGEQCIKYGKDGLPDFFAVILRKQGKWMLAGNWTVAEINEQEIEDDEILMSFDGHGNTATIMTDDATQTVEYTVTQEEQITFNAMKLVGTSKSKIIKRLDKALSKVSQFRPSTDFLNTELLIELKDKESRNVVVLSRPHCDRAYMDEPDD